MKFKTPLVVAVLWGALCVEVVGAIITVTTTNNVSPAAGETSLLQALGKVQDGDQILFNIAGTGPHYIATPAEGYPFITNNNVTINGYSQPGSLPNSNGILAPNNAKIQIVLDSRAGGRKVMSNFGGGGANDDPGYLNTESAVLGVVEGKGFRLQGLSFLGIPAVGANPELTLYFVSFARGASGHIQGCWLGIDPDGKTVAGAADGVTGIRYRARDEIGNVNATVLVNDLVIGVAPKATNAVQQFNVIVGMPAIPILVEGDNTRIAGNFITVLPDGLHDFNVALDDTLRGRFRGAIEIGRSGNNTLIGTDGDGVNDENERNIFGGMLPPAHDGYDHLIEFYGQSPGTNVVIAGNYAGVGIDGKTRFTNGVALLNGSGAAAEYRIGSNFDGVSDKVEGNLILNNYPSELFPASEFAQIPESLNFFSQLNPGATVSLRGNSLIDNFPFPASPALNGGALIVEYYSKALLDATAGVSPTLRTNSTRLRLRGSVPAPDPSKYVKTIVDVYVADPEGITNGMAASLPELPQGFVQGMTYLRSFEEGSLDDLDASPGVFDFDISGLAVVAGTQLTVTANYVGGVSSGGEAGDFTGITQGPEGVTISWTSGTLQSAPAVTGPWSDEVATGNTITVAPSDPLKFFRLQAGEIITASAAPPLTSTFSNAVQVR